MGTMNHRQYSMQKFPFINIRDRGPITTLFSKQILFAIPFTTALLQSHESGNRPSLWTNYTK